MIHSIAQSFADQEEDLAKESQNPIGNIISLPFENNFDFGVGPEDAFVYSLCLFFADRRDVNPHRHAA